jgi:chromosome segregation ATPase
MIEPIMYFGVGFLAAALLGLVIVPLVHARAVRLTMRRMEAATPLSLAEIQADKDQLRADFARATRRLELSVEQLTARSASQLAELSKKTDAVHRLKIDIGDKAATIFALESRDKALRDQLRTTEDELAATTTNLREGEHTLNGKQEELKKLTADLEQRASLADAQRIELVALNTQVDALKERLAGVDQQRQAAEDRVAAMRRELQSMAGELASERDAAAKLSRSAEELERRLARQTAEAERLGQLTRDLETKSLDLSRRLEAGKAERIHLRGEIDSARKIEIDLRSAVAEADGRARSQADILKTEKAQLQSQLERVTDERNRLQNGVNRMQNQPQPAPPTENAEDTMLRERISDVAAEVARLASALEGPNSPIDAILAADAARKNGAANASGASVSEAGNLADRIRALQSAAKRPRQAVGR